MTCDVDVYLLEQLENYSDLMSPLVIGGSLLLSPINSGHECEILLPCRENMNFSFPKKKKSQACI